MVVVYVQSDIYSTLSRQENKTSLLLLLLLLLTLLFLFRIAIRFITIRAFRCLGLRLFGGPSRHRNVAIAIVVRVETSTALGASCSLAVVLRVTQTVVTIIVLRFHRLDDDWRLGVAKKTACLVDRGLDRWFTDCCVGLLDRESLFQHRCDFFVNFLLLLAAVLGAEAALYLRWSLVCAKTIRTSCACVCPSGIAYLPGLIAVGAAESAIYFECRLRATLGALVYGKHGLLSHVNDIFSRESKHR